MDGFSARLRMGGFPRLAILVALVASAGCDSATVRKAAEAERNGEVIDNDIMAQMYPQSFRRGSPEYLERDFEAGADFICDEIKVKYRRDICAEPEIKWR